MSMSGIDLSEAVIKHHQSQTMPPKKIQWTIYKIADKEPCMDQQLEQQMASRSKKKAQEIVIEKVEPKRFNTYEAKRLGLDCESVVQRSRELWMEFISELPEDESRYAVFDYVLPTKSGVFSDKYRFIAWSPDCQKIGSKMIYSSTKDNMKKKLAIQKELFLCSRCPDDVESGFNELMHDGF